jgi:LPXTG-site transpeptidase (sortase) family protein
VGLWLGERYIPVEPTYTEAEQRDGHLYARWQVPLNAAGHHSDTPAFGAQGNVIIVGHSIWYGLPQVFAPLLGVEVGDTLTGVNADGRHYTYRVTGTWATGYEDGAWLSEVTGAKRLTLYTCNQALTGLVIVQAELIEEAS